MKVYFNLPGLFEKFHIIKQIILLYENYPYIFRDNFIISSFYGSNGGVAIRNIKCSTSCNNRYD